MKRILAFICILALASCSLGRKTIKQEEEKRDSASVRTEFVWQVKQIHDSIYLRDSVFVERKGDTIYQNKWRTQYRERLIHDTIIVETTDTLRIRESIKTQETQMSKPSPLYAFLIVSLLTLLVLLIFYFTKD